MAQQQKQTAPAKTVEAEPGILDQVLETTAAKLDQIASRYAEALQDPAMGRLKRAMLTAQGIEQLRKRLDGPVMQTVMQLMNSRLGFLTDAGPHSKKNPQPYSEDVVRECVVEGLLRGVFPVGNEMNIIAGNCYVTREGYERKVREIPGLTDLEVIPGVPAQHNGQTVVRFGAKWKLNGQPCELKDAEGKPGRLLAIPSNQYMGPDAIIGKAIRKGLKAVYQQITGSSLGDYDGDATEPSESNGPSKAETVMRKLEAKLEQKPEPQPDTPLVAEWRGKLEECYAPEHFSEARAQLTAAGFDEPTVRTLWTLVLEVATSRGCVWDTTRKVFVAKEAV